MPNNADILPVFFVMINISFIPPPSRLIQKKIRNIAPVMILHQNRIHSRINTRNYYDNINLSAMAGNDQFSIRDGQKKTPLI